VSLIVDIMSIAVATFAAPLVRSTGDLVRREFARIERGWAAVMSWSFDGRFSERRSFAGIGVLQTLTSVVQSEHLRHRTCRDALFGRKTCSATPID
jgi:hypothetical protein